MISFLTQLWANDQGQDIAEYAVMLAVILVLVVGTIRLIGSNANTVFFASSQFDSVSVTASLKRRQLYSIFTAFLYGM